MGVPQVYDDYLINQNPLCDNAHTGITMHAAANAARRDPFCKMRPIHLKEVRGECRPSGILRSLSSALDEIKSTFGLRE